MASKAQRILDNAERVLIQSMTDEELEAIVAKDPDPEFQAILDDMSMEELEAMVSGGLATRYCRSSKL